MNATLLRPILALCAFAGLLALGGCGGGSGAPNNQFAEKPAPIGPLFVLPSTATVYSHTPATLTVSGGAPPYQAFTSNTSILPVTQIVNGDTLVLLPNNVTADTVVVITVQDSIGQTATSTVTVRAAPIFNTLTITPARTTCGANTVCSGDIATATVTVTGNGGAGIPNRQVKFDVVSGAFVIISNNPAQPQVSTLTVVSDANGVATVVLQASVNAATQPAILRATEVTSGNSVNSVFTIVQVTSGAAILSVVPSTATITGAFVNQCSSNFRIDYYIYGGTAPYTVSSTFPAAVTLVNSTNIPYGGFFTAITNGTCVNPLVFTIVDSVGRQTTATLINNQGTATPPTPPAPGPATLTISPAAYPNTMTPVISCLSSLPFTITGGTAPFSVAFNPPAVLPATSSISPAPPLTGSPVTFNATITGSPPATTYTIQVGDAAKPPQTASATITCP